MNEVKTTTPTVSSEKRVGRDRAGFYKKRRGILEHLEAGTISLLDLAVHDYLNLRANLVIGNGSSIPAGVCVTSAAAIHATCPNQISERAIQRSLEHLEYINWIKRWHVRGKRGNYPVLICRASVHDLSGNEYRVNGDHTIDWQNPSYTPVGEPSSLRGVTDAKLSGVREVRIEKKEKAAEDAAAAAVPLEDRSIKALEEEWKDIGIGPVGSIRFCEAWTHFYDESLCDEKLSDVMERTIQHCQASGIRVPPPFFAAKHRIEKDEVDEVDEIFRIKAPTGPPPELMI